MQNFNILDDEFLVRTMNAARIAHNHIRIMLMFAQCMLASKSCRGIICGQFSLCSLSQMSDQNHTTGSIRIQPDQPLSAGGYTVRSVSIACIGKRFAINHDPELSSAIGWPDSE